MSSVGAIGAAKRAMPVPTVPVPVLGSGPGVAIVALGRARWVWGVEWGDGKVSGGLRCQWPLAGRRTTMSLCVLSLLLFSRHPMLRKWPYGENDTNMAEKLYFMSLYGEV
jgi:hypothetical protein